MNITAGGNDQVRHIPARHLFYMLLGTAIILLVPFVALQFTSEATWAGSDFIVAGILLGGTGMLFELATSTLRTRRTSMLAGAVILLNFLFVSAKLAVGIVGDRSLGS